MYLPLAKRLYTDIQSMNLFDVFMNKSLKHGPFRDVFETMLKAKPIDKFESLILTKRDDIHDLPYLKFYYDILAIVNVFVLHHWSQIPN
jgi:hypothetical protein